MDRNDLTQSAFKCNDTYFEDVVPGYHTLNARGRYLLEKSVNLTDPERADGSIYEFARFPSREIEVEYFIDADNWEEFQERYTLLSRYLNANQARIIFNGEADKYIIGSISSPNEVDEQMFSRSGTYSIICADPFKYAVNETIETPTDGVFEIDYDGTYKSYPDVVVTFPKTLDADGNNTDTSDCGYVGLANQFGAVLQFGDPKAEDIGPITNPATNPFNKTFETSTSASDMTPHDSKTLGDDYIQTGGVSVDTAKKYVYASNYGSGTDYHGPSLSYIIGSQYVATNFALSYRQKMSASKDNQFGCAQVILYNNTGNTRTLIAGVNYKKGVKGKKTSVEFYAGANVKKWSGSKNKKLTAVGTSTITKQGNNVTFKTCNKSVSMELDDTTAGLVANEIVIYFGEKGTSAALATNAFYNLSLTQFAYDTEGDVPNIFMPGDTLTIETGDAGVYLDSGDGTTPAQTLGKLGNDWEDFYLVPGSNTIEIEFSSFVSTPPDVVLKYRKVYI